METGPVKNGFDLTIPHTPVARLIRTTISTVSGLSGWTCCSPWAPLWSHGGAYKERTIPAQDACFGAVSLKRVWK